MIDELDGFVDLPELHFHWEGKSYSHFLRHDPCAYCGKPGGTVDHIVPTSLGSEKGASLNGTGCCLDCNGMKAEQKMLFFLLWKTSTPKQRKKVRRAFFSPEQIQEMLKLARNA